MAQWKQTLEPYVKVIESVKTATLNPTAGGDLIIGAVIISDSGPGVPTLITSQKDFLAFYATQELTEGYMKSLDGLYKSDPGSTLASTMWLNAYRLAGSTHLLINRAVKGGNLIYCKPLENGNYYDYIVKDTDILKKAEKFNIVLDLSDSAADGWAIAINEVGIFGNRVTDDGPIYDYFIDNLPDLIKKLNETNKFFAAKYTYYGDLTKTVVVEEDSEDDSWKSEVVTVAFDEVYIASNFIDKTSTLGAPGFAYIYPTTSDAQFVEAETGTFIGGQGIKITSIKEYYQATSINKAPKIDDEGWAEGEILPTAEKKYVWNYEEISYGDSDSTTTVVHLYASYAPSETVSQVKSYYAVSEEKKVPSKFDETINTPAAGIDAFNALPQTSDRYLWNKEVFVFAEEGVEDQSHVRLLCKLPKTNLGEEILIPSDEKEYTLPSRYILDLNGLKAYAKYTQPEYYVTNVYNSNTDLKVRIRRFNHNAVKQKTLSESEVSQGTSPWTVLQGVLKTYCKDGISKISKSVLHYDFYEICIWDPSISDDAQIFNVGNIAGRGDVKVSDVNNALGMMQLYLPDDLGDLGLNYYNFAADDGMYINIHDNIEEGYVSDPQAATSGTPATIGKYTRKDGSEYLVLDRVSSVKELYAKYPISENKHYGYAVLIGKSDSDIEQVALFTRNGYDEIYVNCKVDPEESSLLDVHNSDIMKAWDEIENDERYIVEGVTDLGCTYTLIQNYLANIAVNGNYFYPVSTANSTNYMTIANFKKKITVISHKLYFLAPWDYDDGTVGFLFGVSPSVLYWEVVSRNRLNNNEFAASFGQLQGIVSPVNLAKEFQRTERQLLLTKKINTIFHDLYLERYYINDNMTAEETEDVLKEEMNARFQIRISKAMPILLGQFKGRQNSAKTRSEVVDVIEYWFKNTVLRYGTTVAGYQIICDESNNTDEDARANRLNVNVNVRFYNSVKYIHVYNVAYPLGIPFEG